MQATDSSSDNPTSLLNPLPFTRGEGVDCSSTAANKFRYPASREGRARHSVRGVPGTPCKPRRARSDAPHPVTELNCHGTSSAPGPATGSRRFPNSQFPFTRRASSCRFITDAIFDRQQPPQRAFELPRTLRPVPLVYSTLDPIAPALPRPTSPGFPSSRGKFRAGQLNLSTPITNHQSCVTGQ